MSEFKPCPFCGSTDIYETYSQEYALGTKNPEIFCNTCKSIFSIEDDSPYMNCDDAFKYRKDKTIEAWNRRASDAAKHAWAKGLEPSQYIEDLPSAQPEIIRCKDCKHYQFADNRAFGMPVKMCNWFGFEDVDDDDFCSRAERRTDE